MTESSKTTNQSQSSTTAPWAPAQGLLTNLIGQYGGLDTSVTGGQSSALDNLASSVSGLPNFGSAGAGAINNLFSSSTAPQVGQLNSAYGTLQNNLGATASGANLDPYSTPGFGDAIKTTMDDITNRTKALYSASGRDPSGAGSFAQSLGRGLTQGVAPTIAAQYNTNNQNMLNANNALFAGAGQTALGTSGLNQTQLQNGLSGISGASGLSSLFSSPALAQLGAANAQYSQPFSNLAQLLQPSTAIAGLGGQSTGQGTSTTTSDPSLMDTISGGLKLGGTGLSAAGSLASAWPALLALSDVRAKTDIAPVGKLNDGQSVYSFRYRGSPKTEIGLMAQEVEKRDPGAVVEIGGLKHVNYGRALAPAARVGALMEAA